MRNRVTAERAATTFVDHSERFGITSTTFNHQFANLYFARLTALRPRVEESACAKWGNSILSRRVSALDAEPNVEVFVVGTIYMEMQHKPSIADEVSRDVLEQFSDSACVACDKYFGDGDALFIEDDAGRLALRLPVTLEQHILVTGAVVGITGTLGDDGVLLVQDLCVPGLAPQQPLGAPGTSGERYVALVSGLRIGHSTQEMLPLQLLAEHLTGQLGCDQDHKLQANIVRLIIAGNATCGPTAESTRSGSGAALDPLQKLAQSEQKLLSQHVRTLDQFLTAVSASMPVDLMPGAEDPCNYLLPQQPFHPCMLPQSSQLSTLNLCTNPYCCEIDGVAVLGSAGQPLDDMQRYVPGDDRMKTLARSLEFQHLAPTAPDTLGCYPFEDKPDDPFVVRTSPHIYFAGNQPRFEASFVEGPAGQRVRTIMVPDFQREHTCVLVSLDTLECKPLVFSGLDCEDHKMQE